MACIAARRSVKPTAGANFAAIGVVISIMFIGIGKGKGKNFKNH